MSLPTAYCRFRKILRLGSAGLSDAAQGDGPDNLAAACALCNRAKSNATVAQDPHTRTLQPLFNPRIHRWQDHFRWSATYTTIVGTTPIGRATVQQLRLNRPEYRIQRALLRAAMRGGAPPWP